MAGSGGIEDQSIRMLMQVHDELVFEIREEKLEEYIAIIKGRCRVQPNWMCRWWWKRVPVTTGIRPTDPV